MVPKDFQIDAAPHRWRVLRCGTGPVALCLHGAGASADSFRPLMAALHGDLTMIAPDLPGHGGTRLGAPLRSGLKAMTEDLLSLVAAFDEKPSIMIGHSAGAAIALMTDEVLSPRGHILINAALSGFSGMAGWVFPAMAKGLSLAPFAAEMMSLSLRNESKLRSLLASTGSETTDEIFGRYARLASNPEHVKGTLRMMASWDLAPLLDRLDKIVTPTLLIAGDRDGTVPDSVSKKAQKTLVNACLRIHAGGHLLHEEAPESVATDIRTFLEKKNTPSQPD